MIAMHFALQPYELVIVRVLFESLDVALMENVVVAVRHPAALAIGWETEFALGLAKIVVMMIGIGFDGAVMFAVVVVVVAVTVVAFVVDDVERYADSVTFGMSAVVASFERRMNSKPCATYEFVIDGDFV